MAIAGALAPKVKLGAALTVTATGAVLTRPPPLATTLTVYLPAGVVKLPPGSVRWCCRPERRKMERRTCRSCRLVSYPQRERWHWRKGRYAPAATEMVAIPACVTAAALPAVTVKLGGMMMVSGKLSVWAKVEALTVSAKL